MKDAAERLAQAEKIAARADQVMQVLVGTWGMLGFGAARGELPGAMELAADMMRVAEESGVTHFRVGARGGLARAHALRGEWAQAARLFEEAIALANEHKVYLEGEGQDLASLAHVYVEVGDAGRAKEAAERGVAAARERGSKIQELMNIVALTRAQVALDDDAIDPLLARAEELIAETRAGAFSPHLSEIRAERARRHGDKAAWRAELAAAHRLFTETGATGHATRVARVLQEQDR
jgi:tetratricopeptide (TPR) repeat protein